MPTPSGFVGLDSLEPRRLLSAIYEIIDLGTLGGPASFAVDLNESLQVVGRSMPDTGPASMRAVQWPGNANPQDLGTPLGYTRSEATATNEAGTVVGTALNITLNKRAMLFAANQGPTDLGTLGGGWSRATAINNIGQVTGTASTPAEESAEESTHAFVWQNDVMTDLGTLGGDVSIGKAINESGHVVGLSFPADQRVFRAFVSREGVMTDLGTLGGPASTANSINNEGVIVGDADRIKTDGNGFNRFHAAIWQDEIISDLGTLGGEFSSALDINNNGLIVGWSEIRDRDDEGDRQVHAFTIEYGEMRDLNDLIDDSEHWQLEQATAINDASYIVGHGLYFADENSPGVEHAFLLRPRYSDLAVQIKAIKAPSIAVPGDKIAAKMTISNLGEIGTNGRFTLEVFASLDTVIDASDPLVVRKINRKIKLKPGQSKTIRVKAVLPANLTPGDYFFNARVTPNVFVREIDPAGNEAASAETYKLAWLFGDFEGRKNVKLIMEDGGGEILKFTIGGNGWGEVTDDAIGRNVTIHNTNGSEKLKITPKQKNDLAAVHNVMINGSLKKIDARHVDLLGYLTATGSVDVLALDDVDSSHLISFNGSGDAHRPVIMTFDQVYDLSVHVDTSIALIAATFWHDTDGVADTIDAVSLDRLLIRGNNKLSLEGNFDADLLLSGAGLEPDDMVLGKVLVTDTIGGANWQVAGCADTIRAGRIATGWTAAFAGRVDDIVIATEMTGELSAEAVDTITVHTDLLDATILLTPAAAGDTALRKLTVGRWIRRTDVIAAGHVGSVVAGATDQFNLFAGVVSASGQLPATASDFSLLSTINRLHIKGLNDGEASVLDTQVAGWSIRRITVKGAAAPQPESPDAAPFAVAAHNIRTLSYQNDAGTIRLRRPEDFLTLPANDLLIRII